MHALQANPEDWTREEVQQWLGHLGFERYSEPFRPIAVGAAKRPEFVDGSTAFDPPCLLHAHRDQAAAQYLLQGRRLLALTQADLYQLVDTKLDADLLSDAIHDLRLRAVSAQLGCCRGWEWHLCNWRSAASGSATTSSHKMGSNETHGITGPVMPQSTLA